jgi:transcriptional regulator with XRE-family HTH domain
VADVKDAKIGDKIKRLRSFRGMTCAELADAIGCTRPYLSAVENGRYPASTKILRKLQQALAVAPDYFTNEDDPRVEDTNRYVRSDTGTFAPGPGGTRVIPFVTLSPGGEPSHDFEEVPSGNTDTIECPGDIEDHQAFAVRVDGDDMAPLIPPGAMAFISPSKALKEGKPVLLRLTSGEMICRLYQARGGQVILPPANLARPVRLVDATDVDWIYPVVRVMIDLYNDPFRSV